MLRQQRKKTGSSHVAIQDVRKLPTEVYFNLVRECLEKNGQAAIHATGVSMMPFLHSIRDTVVIKPPDNSLRRGDIVLFDTKRERYILHRITRVGKNDFDMRGDNTVRGEKHLPKENLVGIVVSVNRQGRIILRGSWLYRFFAWLAPFHYSWLTIRQRILFPIASKLYHLLKPKPNGGN